MKKNGFLIIFIYLSFLLCLISSCTNKYSEHKNKKVLTHEDSIQVQILLDTLSNNKFQTIDSIYILTHYVEKELQKKVSGEQFANYLNEIGIIFYTQSKYYYAEQYFIKATNIYKNNNNKTQVAKNLANIGVLKEVSGSYNEALETYFEALDVFKENNDELSISKIYNNIGVVFNKIENYPKAIEYYKKSYKIKIELDEFDLAAAGLVNLGTIYEDLESIDSAMFYYLQAKKIYVKSKNKLYQATTENNIGYIYLLENQHDSAKTCFDTAMVIFDEFKNLNGQADVYRNIGYMYFLEKDFNKAINNFEISYTLYKTINSQIKISGTSKLLSDSYENIGNYKLANKYLKQHYSIEDTLLHAENQKNINSLEIKFKVLEKDNEINILSAKNNLQNQRIWFISISSALTLLLFLIIILLRQNKNRLQYNMLKQKLFRSQMNPHFIFNALGSIQNFMYQNKPNKAAYYLASFASLTRTILLLKQ